MRGNTVTIEVSLKRGKMAKSVPLYQYDYGQKLIFTNVELPDVYEVHFSNEMYGRAVTMIGDSTGVFIPDEMLVSGSPVYLWLFLHDGADDGETEYTGVIPIIQRAKPDDEEPTPEQQSVITQAIAALNNGVEIVESIAGDVSGALAAALEEAKESGEFDGADGRDGVDGQDGADGYTPQKGIDYNDGADGFSPVVSISTIDGGHRMTVEDAQGTQSVDIMDGAKGDKGDTGSVENVFASTVPMSPDDDTTILNAMGDKISKLTNATSGNFASFDANGGIEDSGHSHSDYLTQHQDISGKVDVTDFFATEMPMSDQDATTVSSAISMNSTAIANVQNGLAYIVGNTNTTGATLAVGQFVYVKGHSTIAEGLRKVTASISANGNITTSNTSSCSEGGLNALNSNIANIESYTNLSSEVTASESGTELQDVSLYVQNKIVCLNCILKNSSTSASKTISAYTPWIKMPNSVLPNKNTVFWAYISNGNMITTYIPYYATDNKAVYQSANNLTIPASGIVVINAFWIAK